MAQQHLFNYETIKRGDLVIDTNFQTPPRVCDLMASMVPLSSKIVMEPTPGVGNIINALQRKQFNVFSPEDFFLLDRSLRFDAIVMNPPFSSKWTYMKNAPPILKN